MTVSGHIYGVVLNDKAERERISHEFEDKPYSAPPVSPVVYMKPASALARGPVRIAAGMTVNAAATLALLFARDACRCDPAAALATVGASALALDISYPRKDYYRPAIAQQNADGFLLLGEWQPPCVPDAIETAIDGTKAHGWSLDRLVRDPATLIADLSAFMTLRAGDVLLIGLAGDAPQAGAGRSIAVSADGLPTLRGELREIAA